jgi:hypothetical protein
MRLIERGKIMKIYYKDLVDGKKHYTNPKSYEITEVNFLDKKVKAIIAHRKSSDLIIPHWCVSSESLYLFRENKEDRNSR